MINFIILIIITFIFSIPNNASGQSSKDVYKALKKIEANVQTGLSYNDYRRELGDAQFELNLFLESKEARQQPQLALHMKKAMIHYLNAAKVWSYPVEEGRAGFFSPYVHYAYPTEIYQTFFK
jgi:hypothetical protein